MAPTTGTLSRAERKKAELRQEIVDAAFACFAEKGYHATAIADIAAFLGIGHGTFYRYFENKRDIVEHVISDVIERILGALTDENAPDAAETLDEYRAQTARIGVRLTQILEEDPRVPRMLLIDAPGIDKAMADRVLEFFGLATTLIGAYLSHGVEKGYLPGDLDVDNTARAINGMIVGSVIAGLQDAGLDHRAQAEAIQRVMYDGIAPR